jgi:hypothetical protein
LIFHLLLAGGSVQVQVRSAPPPDVTRTRGSTDRDSHLASADAKRNDNPEIRARFEDEERTYRDLTERCERLARQPAQLDLLDLPVLRQPT